MQASGLLYISIKETLHIIQKLKNWDTVEISSMSQCICKEKAQIFLCCILTLILLLPEASPAVWQSII